jgi:hypothetical protein
MTTPNIDPYDKPIWGAAAFAAVLNTTPKAVEHMLRNGLLDADQIGGRNGRHGRWVSTPRRLLRRFSSKSEPAR